MCLLCFGALNIAVRATSHKLEDGVLWEARPEGVTAADVAARGGAMAAGIRPGDVLVAIDGAPVETVEEVQRRARSARSGPITLSYTVLRLGEQQMLNVEVAPVPGGNPTLYIIGAAIGIFTLACRRIRPAAAARRSRDAAFLLALPCVFRHADVLVQPARSARLVFLLGRCRRHSAAGAPLPALHSGVSRSSQRAGCADRGKRLLALLYAPAGVLFAVECGGGRPSAAQHPALLAHAHGARSDRAALSVAVHDRRAGRADAGDGSTSDRRPPARQLRWIIWGTAFGAGPFAIGYALPYALGLRVPLPMELSVIPLSLVPLAFASALIRYRLMDVEVIVKRSLVYTAVILAIFTIYATLLRLAGIVFLDAAERHNMIIAMLATIVVVLLFSPVKSAIQNALDRAFYRDKYDYRRALVGFARDLNSDLDLDRLSERLVARIRETFVIDRMALLLVNEGSGDYEVIRVEGFGDLAVSGLGRHSQLAASLAGGIALSLDDPRLHGAFPVEELAFWRVRGVHYFVPCVSKGGTIAVLALGQRGQGEPLSSEDMGFCRRSAATSRRRSRTAGCTASFR